MFIIIHLKLIAKTQLVQPIYFNGINSQQNPKGPKLAENSQPKSGWIQRTRQRYACLASCSCQDTNHDPWGGLCWENSRGPTPKEPRFWAGGPEWTSSLSTRILVRLMILWHLLNQRNIKWTTKKTVTFHYTGWLIGILIMVYNNPYITGRVVV